MATELTTIAPEALLFPYSGLDDPSRELSIVPRQEVRFIDKGTTVPDPGVGDNQAVSVLCLPPPNFAYALVDLNLFVQSSLAGTFNLPKGFFTLFQDALTSAASTVVASLCVEAGVIVHSTGGAVDTFQYCLRDPFRQIMVPQPGNQVSLGMSMFNPTADDVDYTVAVYCRMLMFDINQANHYSINTPQLVR